MSAGDEPDVAGPDDETPLLLAVGRVMIAGARVEDALNRVIANLVGHRASIAVQGQPVGILTEMIDAIGRDADEPLRTALRTAARLAKAAMKRRDDVAHGAWIGSWTDGTGFFGYAMARHRRYKGHSYDQTDLEQLAAIRDALYEALAAVYEANDAVLADAAERQ